MTYPDPIYQKTFLFEQLDYGKPFSNEILNAAAKGIQDYMQKETFWGIFKQKEGSIIRYSGLVESGSTVFLSGETHANNWQNGSVTVVNMQKKDKGLVELLKKVAIDATRK